MKKLALIFILLFLPACSATSIPTAVVAVPTSAPGATGPSASPAPALTRSAIRVQDIKTNTQANGSASTTAQVTADNLGLGQIEVSYHDTMLISESQTLRLRISPAQQLVSLTPVAVPGKTPELPSFAWKFGGNIDIYPLMIAEIRALKFDVTPQGPIKRTVDPKSSIIWDWIVSPRETGRQDLFIEMSIPAVINGVDFTQVLQDLPLVIQVQSPTPTPAPLANQIGTSMANNAGTIIVALIGLIGTVIGLVYKAKTDSAKSKK